MQRNAQSVVKKSISLYLSSSSSLSVKSHLKPHPPHFSTLSPSSRSRHVSLHNPTATRSFSGHGGGGHEKEIDEINRKFAEAREEIEAALESKETVYFDEEAECARDAVKSVLDKFDGLLASLPEKDKMALHRSMGLKIQQLKAELEQLNE